MRGDLPLPQLRAVLLVAELGSFSAAARRLGVAQSTVSAAVSGIEEQLGSDLFRRTTRRVEVSAFGEKLLPAIHDVLNSADALASLAKAALEPQRKLVRIAVSPLIDSRRVSALLHDYRDAHPDVEVVFKECEASDLEGRLSRELA